MTKLIVLDQQYSSSYHRRELSEKPNLRNEPMCGWTHYDEELKIDIANAMSKGELGINGEDYKVKD